MRLKLNSFIRTQTQYDVHMPSRGFLLQILYWIKNHTPASFLNSIALDWSWPQINEMGRGWHHPLRYWYKPSRWFGVHGRDATNEALGFITWGQKSPSKNSWSKYVFSNLYESYNMSHIIHHFSKRQQMQWEYFGFGQCK